MDITDRMRRLADLHRQGLLTDAEFNDAKRRALEQAGAAASTPEAADSPAAGQPSAPATSTIPAASSHARTPPVGSVEDRVYRTLFRAGDAGLTAADIAEEMGRSVGTVVEVLTWLDENGLAAPSGTRWVRRPGAPSPGSRPAGPVTPRPAGESILTRPVSTSPSAAQPPERSRDTPPPYETSRTGPGIAGVLYMLLAGLCWFGWLTTPAVRNAGGTLVCAAITMYAVYLWRGGRWVLVPFGCLVPLLATLVTTVAATASLVALLN